MSFVKHKLTAGEVVILHDPARGPIRVTNLELTDVYVALVPREDSPTVLVSKSRVVDQSDRRYPRRCVKAMAALLTQGLTIPAGALRADDVLTLTLSWTPKGMMFVATKDTPKEPT